MIWPVDIVTYCDGNSNSTVSYGNGTVRTVKLT